MNEVIGEKVTYFITQINNDTKNESFVEYNDFNGSFMTTSGASSATRFNLLEQAVDLAKLQDQMSKLLNRRFSYRVVKEVITRSEVYTGVEPAGEGEVSGEE